MNIKNFFSKRSPVVIRALQFAFEHIKKARNVEKEVKAALLWHWKATCDAVCSGYVCTTQEYKIYSRKVDIRRKTEHGASTKDGRNICVTLQGVANLALCIVGRSFRFLRLCHRGPHTRAAELLATRHHCRRACHFA